MTGTTYTRPKTIQPRRTNRKAKSQRSRIQSEDVEAFYFGGKLPTTRQHLCHSRESFGDCHCSNVYINIPRDPVISGYAFERKTTTGSKPATTNQVHMTRTTHASPKTIQSSRTRRKAKLQRRGIQSQYVEALYIGGKLPTTRKKTSRCT